MVVPDFQSLENNSAYNRTMDDKVKHFYENYYSEVVSSGLVGKYQAHIHSLIEKDLPKLRFDAVLELGAGKLEHSKHSRIVFKEYWATDLQMQKNRKSVLVKDSHTGLERNFQTFSLDAQSLNGVETRSIDLLLSTCLLIHLPAPFGALSEWRRVVRDNGFLVIYVPCDPGIFLRFMRQVTNKRKYGKLGFLEYDLICSLEHLSSLHVLNNLIKEVFKGDKIKVRRGPFNFLHSWNFNLFYIYTIQVIKN
jgi:SAM-dependent methyltransferase